MSTALPPHPLVPSPRDAASAGPLAPDLVAATLLVGPALLTLVLVLHHPVLPPAPPGGRTVAETAADIVHLGPALGIVHGALLALLAAQTLGLQRFSARLGWGRLTVAAGFLAYVAGVLLLAIPALLDGFVTPAVAAACVRAAREAVRECGPADGATLRLVAVMIQVFTKAGLLLLSAAAGAWAVALLGGAGDVGGFGPAARRRAVGALGIVCAVAPALVLVGTALWLRPGTLAALLAAQSVWACAVGALMARAGTPQAAPASVP